MGQSKFSKIGGNVRNVAQASGVGGQTIRIKLNQDNLIAEHKFLIQVAQTYAGGAPTSVDVRDFISKIEILANGTTIKSMTGAQAYDLGRFTENASLVKNSAFSTGSNTSEYGFDVHYENDESIMDMMTAMPSGDLTSFEAVLTFAADTNNGFKGGTSATAASYNVTVESHEYQASLAKQVQNGFLPASWLHRAFTDTQAGTTTGAQKAFDLQNLSTRFLMIHAYDTTGAKPVLTDAIVGDLSINIAGLDRRVTTFALTQQDNSVKRAFYQAGVAVIDFGDDEAGWLALENVKNAKLNWTVKAGAPASYNVVLGQDCTSTAISFAKR